MKLTLEEGAFKAYREGKVIKSCITGDMYCRHEREDCYSLDMAEDNEIFGRFVILEENQGVSAEKKIRVLDKRVDTDSLNDGITYLRLRDKGDNIIALEAFNDGLENTLLYIDRDGIYRLGCINDHFGIATDGDKA
jgi:hypothetical protein